MRSQKTIEGVTKFIIPKKVTKTKNCQCFFFGGGGIFNAGNWTNPFGRARFLGDGFKVFFGVMFFLFSFLPYIP